MKKQHLSKKEKLLKPIKTGILKEDIYELFDFDVNGLNSFRNERAYFGWSIRDAIINEIY